jgi:hypothetical protein
MNNASMAKEFSSVYCLVIAAAALLLKELLAGSGIDEQISAPACSPPKNYRS